MRNLKQENTRTTPAKRGTNNGVSQHYTGGPGLYNSRTEMSIKDQVNLPLADFTLLSARESEFI